MKIVAKYQIDKDKFELTLEKINSLENQEEGNFIFDILSMKKWEYLLFINMINARKF